MENISLPAPDSAGKTGAIPSHLDFPVVGIGASAGGLQALLRLFENMPADNGMAFVVILHLSPRHESNADAVLQRATRMPVSQVLKPQAIEKNHVYVISPKKQLSMNDGYLGVAEVEHRPGPHVAIDLFFCTLADAHKERAIGIVLSGTGSDGAGGLMRVKEQGGVTLAQLPTDAEYDGMPQAAIGTNAVDFVLPVAEMPQKLIDIAANARAIRLPPSSDAEAPEQARSAQAPDADAERALHDVLMLLRSHTGHDFRHYKRATVLRRIERRLQVRGLTGLPEYRELLQSEELESRALLGDMLIGVTNFFRDGESFEALEREVLPQLFHNKHGDEQVRAWVPACSSGEEAYSLAILLTEQANLQAKPPAIQVFATDIDEQAIATARAGVYPATIVADVPTNRLHQYFTAEEGRYRIRKAVRDGVLFAAHNLLRDPPFSRLDLISCRNLLIYLNRDVQIQLLEMFNFALNPGGFLFLGSSESADAVGNFFTAVDKKNRIYRARIMPRSARYTPSLPFGAPAVHSAPAAQPAPDKAPQRRFSFDEVHQRVLAQYAPPSVIVNQESNIVHMSDRAGRFLRHVGGEPSRNLVSLVLPELRVELRTALYQAWQSGKSVEARRVELKRDDRTWFVNMTARPFHDDAAAADFALVLFHETEETLSETPPGDRKDIVVTQLEQELQRTKEQLQETIEQSEVSTEELRASNEELQAINEELRSATEELETSKEELQSVNEELITVNYELKMKVEETGKVNDDLNNLIASTDIATVFVDRAMRIKRYTPRATDIFNIIAADIGRSLLDITHRLEYGELAADATATFETLRVVEREVRSADGSYYIARMLPYRTTEDKIDGAVLTFFNITGRRQAEQRLAAGEERMRLAAESTKDYAIITTDTEGGITSWNKGAERMFGYLENEVIGSPVDLIFSSEDRAAGAPAEERRRALEDGRAEDERWHRRKDGSRLYCSGVMTPLRNGEFYGFAKIARDQTEHMLKERRREAQLSTEQQRRGAAQSANAMKDEFLAIMSHELRHPLNLIHINAELLTRMPEVAKSPGGARAARIICNAVLNQAKIIDDLLDLSRLNTGKLTLAPTEVDLPAVVASIVEVMHADPAAAGMKIKVTSRQERIVILADRVRVEQVILNLLDNAIKFSPPDASIELRLGLDQNMGRLDVIDSGEGIAAEFLPHVFDMFGQASSSTMRSKGGLGIGLTLVKHIAELHHGRVEADSRGPGQGSRFSVWFPLQGTEQDESAGYRSAGHSGIKGIAILLVDDVEDAISGLKLLLEIEGAKVATATSAAEALQVIDRQSVDLLVSDIAMPGMDGYELIREIRKKPGLGKLPAIAVTGMGRLEDAERAREAGFSSHISKPVPLDVLVQKAMELCGKRE